MRLLNDEERKYHTIGTAAIITYIPLIRAFLNHFHRNCTVRLSTHSISFMFYNVSHFVLDVF